MNKKIFRLFISSTFSDFYREREVLQTTVFPQLKTYCAEYGYTFQPIDLRWGVSNEAQLDQKTLELCLGEVQTCKSHPHPNFLVMIGDRYGWLPLPYAIESTEFETLLNLMNQSDKHIVLNWYREDLNHLPASYILKERSGEYVEHQNWEPVETRLRTILQDAVTQSSLTGEQQHKYFLSATEAEIEEGIISYFKPTAFQQKLINQTTHLQEIDPQQVFGFFRDIENPSTEPNRFIGIRYAEAQKLKQRVKATLREENTLQAQTTQQDQDHLDEQYLEEFTARTINFLKQQVDTHRQQKQEYSSLEIEQQAQHYYAEQKQQNFMGQETALAIIADYITNDQQQPLIIVGRSGSGKSALMAKAIEQTETASTKKIIYRFVGATPHASSTKPILTSIFEELGIDVRNEQEKEQNAQGDGDEQHHTINQTNEEQETFEQFSYRVYDEINRLTDQIVIFIDAVDQLGNDDPFLWLPQELPDNIKIIISALDDKKYPEDSQYFKTLQDKTTNLHQMTAFNEPLKLLHELLRRESRTLQPRQENYFLTQFKSSSSPLYVDVVAREVNAWRSYDGVVVQEENGTGRVHNLSTTQQAVILEFISNLHNLYHHEQHFVQKVLGYLCASRGGLSESELLALLAMDEGFIKAMAPDAWHKNTTRELPLVIWTRLHAQLKPFLRLTHQDGEALMTFFHREFENVIKGLPGQRAEHEAVIEAIQQLITLHQEEDFDSNRWGKLYVTLITEYDFRYGNEEKQQSYAIFISSLSNEGWIEGCLNNLNNVGYDHHIHNQMVQAIIYGESYLHATTSLYQVNPESWAKDYTITLNNLAQFYNKFERNDEAITLQKESLDILTPLYQANPALFAEHYTRALNNLADSCGQLGRTDEAISLEKENLNILTPLYQTNPKRWAGSYTTALNNLAQSYSKFELSDEAITLLEESLPILIPLYQASPKRWLENYTATLGNLALSYSQLNRTDEAISLEKENLNILTPLYQANPEQWAEDYANKLHNLAASYSKLDHNDEATTLLEECLSILIPLYQANPKRWLKHYATALNTLASVYSELERTDEATTLLEECLSIRKALYLENQDRWAEDYVFALNNLATLFKLNRTDEAITLEEESLSILKTLYQTNPDRWCVDYAIALNDLAISYGLLGRTNEVIAYIKESLPILKTLYHDHPEWAEYYTTALGNLARSFRKLGRTDEAIPFEKEYRDISKPNEQQDQHLAAELQEQHTFSNNNIADTNTSIISLLFTISAVVGFVIASLTGITKFMRNNSQLNDLVHKNFDKYIGIESIMSIDTLTFVMSCILIVTGYFLRNILKVILAGILLVLLVVFVLNRMTGVPDISYGPLLRNIFSLF